MPRRAASGRWPFQGPGQGLSDKVWGGLQPQRKLKTQASQTTHRDHLRAGVGRVEERGPQGLEGVAPERPL